MRKPSVDVKGVITWIPVLLLVVALVVGLLDPMRASVVHSLIQWILFLSVGGQNTWRWLAHVFYGKNNGSEYGKNN